MQCLGNESGEDEGVGKNECVFFAEELLRGKEYLTLLLKFTVFFPDFYPSVTFHMYKRYNLFRSTNIGG
jgi:hypothetical protein